jgi:hypothetical protein
MAAAPTTSATTVMVSGDSVTARFIAFPVSRAVSLMVSLVSAMVSSLERDIPRRIERPSRQLGCAAIEVDARLQAETWLMRQTPESAAPRAAENAGVGDQSEF